MAAFKNFLPTHAALADLMSDISIHSDVEVDNEGHQTRKVPFWRSYEVDILFDHIDELHIHSQVDSRVRSNAIKSLRRGTRVEMNETEKLNSFPPLNFPVCLMSDLGFKRLSLARKSVIKPSDRQLYDIEGLIKELGKWGTLN